MAYKQSDTPNRMPRDVNREQLPHDQPEDFQNAVARATNPSPFAGDPLKTVDGEPFPRPYLRTLSYSPPVSAVEIDIVRRLPPINGEHGTVSMADYGLTCVLEGFDSGCWVMHAAHTVVAVGAGVRVECLKALRDGREDDLTDDERQKVQFIRAVRDGSMSDEIWKAMETKQGSYRATLELTWIVLYLIMHHRLMRAVGQPAMHAEDWNTLIEEFESGVRNPSEQYLSLQNFHNTPGDPLRRTGTS